MKNREMCLEIVSKQFKFHSKTSLFQGEQATLPKALEISLTEVQDTLVS